MSNITKIFDKIRGLAPEGEAVIAVLEVAQSVTGLGGTAAAQGLRLIEAALKALEDGSHDPVTHAQILQQVAQLHADADAERAREDAELAALGASATPAGT